MRVRIKKTKTKQREGENMADIVTTITDFLSSERHAHFIIPEYQRVYSWTKKQWKTLCSDIFELTTNNRTHFMGGIISITSMHGDDDNLEIIDGQQRITSISLFILALIKWGRQRFQSEDGRISDECYDKFRRLMGYIGESTGNGQINERVKLILRENIISTNPISDDNNEYNRARTLSNSNAQLSFEENQISRVMSAFKFFYEEINIKGKNIDPREYFSQLCNALRRIKVSHIPLRHDQDDPQQVFESMNATGLSLCESDKCRNLMVLSDQSQERYWVSRWLRVERSTMIQNKSETDMFLQSFLKLYNAKHGKSKPKVGAYYDDFKSIVKSFLSNEEITTFYEELSLYADYYNKFKDGSRKNGDGRDDSYIKRYRSAYGIVNLKITQFWPLILEMIDYVNNNRITECDFERILNSIETYIVRKQICNERIDADTIVVNIIKKLKDNQEYNKIVDLVCYYIAYPYEDRMKPSMPNADVFTDSLRELDLYKKPTLCRAILEDIEIYLQQTGTDHVDTTDATIEHVMPQTLNDEWRKYIDYTSNAQLYKQWVNRLGNLTLINPNTELGNKIFYNPEQPGTDKMTFRQEQYDGSIREIGYRASRFCLNDDIKKQNQWRFDEIERRHNQLIELCQQIWCDIITDYEPPADGLLERNLGIGNLTELSQYSVARYKFEEDELIDVDRISWQEFLRRCVDYLLNNYAEDLLPMIQRGVYKEIIYSDVIPKGRWIESNVLKNVYVANPGRASASSMLPPIIMMINHLDLNPEEFVFFIRRNG